MPSPNTLLRMVIPHKRRISRRTIHDLWRSRQAILVKNALDKLVAVTRIGIQAVLCPFASRCDDILCGAHKGTGDGALRARAILRIITFLGIVIPLESCRTALYDWRARGAVAVDSALDEVAAAIWIGI